MGNLVSVCLHWEYPLASKCILSRKKESAGKFTSVDIFNFPVLYFWCGVILQIPMGITNSIIPSYWEENDSYVKF